MQGGGLRTTNCEPELAPTYRPRSFSRRLEAERGSGPIRQNGERMVELMVREVEWKMAWL